MPYSQPGQPIPPMVSLMTSGWGVLAERLEAYASGNAVTTLRYYPLWVPTTCVARRLWWVNGSTVSASYNIDVAIYADAGYKPGTKLISTGSTAQGTASEVQFVDITDTTLAPGLYWLAIVASNTLATIFRTSAPPGAYSDAVYGFSENTSTPPATATPAELATSTVYLFGFATTASP